MRHAEPWLLTIKSKPWSQARFTSDPDLENQHNTSVRKRCRQEVPHETEEPPAKKSAADKQEDKDREDAEIWSDKTGEKLNEEEQLKKQKERADEASGDKLLSLEEEGGQQVQPEEEGHEEARQEKMETEERHEKKEEDSVTDERDEEAGDDE